MDVNFFHFVIFGIGIINSISASKNTQPLPGEFSRGDCSAVSRCENDFRRNYSTTAKKPRLFTPETHLKRKVCYIGQIAMYNFPPLTIIVGKLRMNYKKKPF